MKKIALSAILAGLIVSSPSFAEPGFYIGGSFGNGKINHDAYNDPSLGGVLLGYDFGKSFSLEFQTLSGEDNLDISGTAGIYDLSTSALYGTWRSEGEFYTKAKIGFLSETITATTATATATAKDSGLSIGIGLGFKLNEQIRAEAEYTIIEQDINAFTLSVSYQFQGE
jgi:opacity protein-like surface antigen